MIFNDEQKIKFILDKLLERNNILYWSFNRLFKKGSDEPENKAYYPVPVLLLCFCFLDFLRRFNYIWENGKDGRENKNHRTNYIDFLDQFIISNDRYTKYNYSFGAEDLYNIRNDLVHSFGLRETSHRLCISFVDGLYFNNKEKLNNLEKELMNNSPELGGIHLIKIGQFIEIIKCGIQKMSDKYRDQLIKVIQEKNPEQSKQLKIRLNELYKELKNTTCYFEEILRSSNEPF